jgi:hypothetical protein
MKPVRLAVAPVTLSQVPDPGAGQVKRRLTTQVFVHFPLEADAVGLSPEVTIPSVDGELRNGAELCMVNVAGSVPGPISHRPDWTKRPAPTGLAPAGASGTFAVAIAPVESIR